jgi:hypothetical protein
VAPVAVIVAAVAAVAAIAALALVVVHPGWGVSSHLLPSASGHGGLGMSSEYAFCSVSG